ncbi:glycosyltransferase family 4 protein [Candidatus Roizmanbacteria bacterium]|nr:glycosyltransferase family 4 protein [Candidatus Roizmanbacteria bacterium]
MKIAIVHDQLQEFGGAERVLVSLMDIFPHADLYTAYYNPSTLGHHAEQTKKWNIHTTWADRIPGFKRLASPLRFLTPFIWESINFSDYDLVISSSGTMMCKGIITRPETPHICYLHHPPRYLYYYETALEWQKHILIKIYGNLINQHLREWDFLSSQRVDHFIANSEETKRRIQKYYRCDADVIYPPVMIPKDLPRNTKKKNYYLTISRLARAKHLDILIEAANKKKLPLKIVGQGRDYAYLKSLAGDTVELVGGIPDNELEELYAGAKAFLFASRDEEFGIAPIEAMGRGIPVIAYASGGLKETIQPGHNGYLFSTLSADSLLEQVEILEKTSVPEYEKLCQNARQESLKYSFEVFKKKVTDLISTFEN